MKLAIVGDSHVVALGEGLRAMRAAGEVSAENVLVSKLYSGPTSLKPFFTFEDRTICFTDRVLGLRLAQVTGRDTLSEADRGTVFAVSMGLMTTIFTRLSDWDRFVPWQFADSEKSAVSTGTIEAIARDHNRYAVEFYRALLSLGLSCIAIAAPPPRIDEAARARMAPQLLVEIDAIARRVVAHELGALGVSIVRPSPAVYAEGENSGLLRPELARYQGDDTHHANQQYGRLMLPRVLDAARTASGASYQH